MAYIPHFSISASLLSEVERIAALRERIQSATVDLGSIPALQKEARARNVHASTAIEGNTLTLEQVRELDEGGTPAHARSRAIARMQREVMNCFAAFRQVEQNISLTPIRQEHLLELHRILAGEVMDQGEAGAYRMIGVRVGNYFPPPPDAVSGLMFELLEWWNTAATKLSPALSFAILHHRFESIHPFADGNGRMGRALSLWELCRRGFDAQRILSVDEFYWEDRPRYYKELDAVRRAGDDLSAWLEYSAEGLRQTLERTWLRIQSIQGSATKKLALRPRQQRLLHLLRDQGSMAPNEIWSALSISRQGAMDLLKPLIAAGLVEKVGGAKTGHYVLRNL